MNFLRWIATWRNPVFDAVFGALTYAGGEVVFIVAALVVLWCVDKKRGYYLLFCGFFGLVTVQILKMAFRIPRPWVLDPAFQIVENARAGATGYSFPSGHTQTAVTLFGGLAVSSRRKAVKIGGWVACALVAFSRMYLGVHTPLDVGVSFAVGVCIVLATKYLTRCADRTRGGLWWFCGAALALTLGNLLFVELYAFPADVDMTNYTDAVKVAWQILGMVLGLAVAYSADRYKTRYRTEAVWWGQVLKVALGLGLMLGLRAVLKAPLNALLGLRAGVCVRYFIMVALPASALPFLFRFLPKGRTRGGF